jgi:hypothetical protein
MESSMVAAKASEKVYEKAGYWVEWKAAGMDVCLAAVMAAVKVVGLAD